MNKNNEEASTGLAIVEDMPEQQELTKEEFNEQLPQGLISRSEPFETTWDRGKFTYEGLAVKELWRDGDVVKELMVRTLVTRQRVKDTSKYNPKECNKAGNR